MLLVARTSMQVTRRALRCSHARGLDIAHSVRLSTHHKDSQPGQPRVVARLRCFDAGSLGTGEHAPPYSISFFYFISPPFVYQVQVTRNMFWLFATCHAMSNVANGESVPQPDSGVVSNPFLARCTLSSADGREGRFEASSKSRIVHLVRASVLLAPFAVRLV